MITQTIVKKPGKNYVKGLTTANLGAPNYEILLNQHTEYIEALKECQVDVHILPADENLPDSTFVEDTAVLTKECAIITKPGAPSRADEILAIEPALRTYYDNIYYIKSPGTLDGGDVLQIENHFFIGLSSRTNKAGAQQLSEYLKQHNYEATIVTLENLFHLKTGIAYIGRHTILVTDELIDHQAFATYEKIIVPKDEAYAANCIRINDYVIIPKGYPKTKKKIERENFQTIEVNTSEFRKHDGGLSCLSLRF